MDIWGLPDISTAILSLMTMITMVNKSDDDLKRRIEELDDFENWDLDCESCGKSSLLQDYSYTREEERLSPIEILNFC